MFTLTLGIRRSGVTLAELLVVIVILGLIAGIALQGVASAPRTANAVSRAAIERQLIAARSAALRTRRPVVVRVVDSLGAMSAVALPDGSVIGDAPLSRDRLTGTRRDSIAARE